MTRATFVVFLAWSTATGQPFVVSTFAGGPPGSLAPVAAVAASIGQPESVVADTSGNVYVSSSANYVFKVDSKGVLTRIAGNGHAGYSGDGGPATQSALNFTAADFFGFGGGALAADQAGNLYIADSGNQRIRKISSDGTITTIAGNGEWGDRGDGGPALDARLGTISGIAVDSAGQLYIADHGYRNRIRVISPGGIIDTLPACAALNLQDIAGLATDSQGNLYVADYAGNRVVEVSAAGVLQTIAGTGVAGYSGDGGPATSAQLKGPFGLALDAAGNLYIADSGNSRIRQIAPGGILETVAGGGRNFGSYTGAATSAGLSAPYGLATDATGNLLIADTWQLLIRKVSAGSIGTVAGNGNYSDAGDGGPAANAQFSFSLPSGVPIWGGALAFDGQNNLYLADTANLQIRMIAPSGTINRFAGTGTNNDNGGDYGSALAATINFPYGLATDRSGDLYISDGLIRVVGPNGVISTAAVVTAPPLEAARSIAVDAAGNLYFGSFGGIEKVSSTGTLSLVTSQIAWSLAADAAGNLYAGDINGYVVRKIAPGGTVTVVAGNGTPGFSGDGGPATNAQLNTPAALAVDANGNLYIADCFNYRIRMVTPDGIISTIAGNGSPGYAGDGGNALQAHFGLISGMAADSSGNLYAADQTYNLIRLISRRN